MSPAFEPRIVALLCNWCSYAAADLAGTQRVRYPANVRVVHVPCSGRVHSGYVLQALMEGADGVIVAGCHPGECHYDTGNRIALRRITMLSKLLEYVGVEPERVRLAWVSAAEGRRFAEMIGEMTEQLAALGPFEAFRRREVS